MLVVSHSVNQGFWFHSGCSAQNATISSCQSIFKGALEEITTKKRSHFRQFLGSISVHTTPEEFENGIFTLKPHQMFSVRTTPEKLKTQQSPAVLDLCLLSEEC